MYFSYGIGYFCNWIFQIEDLREQKRLDEIKFDLDNKFIKYQLIYKKIIVILLIINFNLYFIFSSSSSISDPTS